MATYSLPNSADCCESDGTLKCPEVECGSCEESDDCPLWESGYYYNGKPKYGYYFYCAPPTDGTEHGMEEPYPTDCWGNDQFASRVWLYGTTCVIDGVYGGVTYYKSNNVPIAGPLTWDQDACAYLGSGYELRGVDPVNGKRFVTTDNTTWNLVDDFGGEVLGGGNLSLAAPSLKLPDGSMIYTSEYVGYWSQDGYDYYLMGETHFINTADITFVDGGTFFEGPDWTIPLSQQTISVDFRNITNPNAVSPYSGAPTFCNQHLT